MKRISVGTFLLIIGLFVGSHLHAMDQKEIHVPQSHKNWQKWRDEDEKNRGEKHHCFTTILSALKYYWFGYPKKRERNH